MTKLSPKSYAVLSLIAEGYSYGQIVESHPEITYLDIFHAAEEALRLSEAESSYQARIAKIKEKYTRAYQNWETAEDDRLRELHLAGKDTTEIGSILQRQPSAIRSRLNKLGLNVVMERPNGQISNG